MSSPRSTASGTPTRRSGRNNPSSAASSPSVSSRLSQRGEREVNMDTSDLSDLARPLPPSSPIKSPSSVASSLARSKKKGPGQCQIITSSLVWSVHSNYFVPADYLDRPGGPPSVYGGPGSVLVSEIDLVRNCQCQP